MSKKSHEGKNMSQLVEEMSKKSHEGDRQSQASSSSSW
jgi:hypothetical protein